MRIRQILLATIAILAGALPAWAQSARYDSIAISSRGTPVPNATITVCTQPAVTTTQPCSPLATLATSTSTVSGGSNPLTADVNGNFHFYAVPGLYTVQIFSPQISPATVLTDQNVGFGNAVVTINPANCTATGINNAVAGLSATGGMVDARSCTAGRSGETTTITVGSNSQYGITVLMPCATWSGSANPIAFVNLRSTLYLSCPSSILQQTGASGNGVIVAGNNGSPGLVGGVDGYGQILGPGVGTSTGQGLILGGTSDVGNSTGNSANYVKIGPITVTGFQFGETIGNNVFTVEHAHTMFQTNANPLQQTSSSNGSAETINYHDVTMSTSGSSVGTIQLTGGTNGGEFYFVNSSFDGTVFNINAPNRMFLYLDNPHMEMTPNVGAVTTPFITTSGCSSSTLVEIKGGFFLEDTVSARTRMLAHGCGTLRLYGPTLQPQETVAAAIALSGSAITEVYGLATSSISSPFSGSSTGQTLYLGASTAGIGTPELSLTGNPLIYGSTPSVSAGFNTGSVTASNGTAFFVVTVGSGVAGSTGTVTLPTVSNFWGCHADNQSRADLILMTNASATTAVFTNFGTTFAATNWTNGDIINIWCDGR